MAFTLPKRNMSFAGMGAFVLVLAAALVGCGSNATAAGTSTTPCPTRTTGTRGQTAVGTITALQAGSATITTATSGSVTLTFGSSTRFTVLKAVPATSLTEGTMVQVYAGAASASGGTDAQRVIVQTGTGTFGAGSGTPTTGARPGRGGGNFNPACRPTGTPGAAFRGVRGTITSLDLDLHTFTVTDARGGTYSFTLTSSTVVGTQSQGTAASLKVGDSITATGTSTGAGLQAAIVQDQTAH